MMLEILFVLLFLLFLVTILIGLAYCGLFESIEVKVGPSPISFSGRTVAYKTARGPYTQSGHLFTELTGDLLHSDESAGDLMMIGFYYDDPDRRQADRLRYAVGVILPDDDPDLSQKLTSDLHGKDYNLMTLPTIDHVVHASFPNRGPVACVIATRRVYPLIRSYISDHRLCAHPALEIYTSDNIYFILPLSKQDSFYLFDEVEEEEDDEEEGSGNEGEIGDASDSGASDRNSNSEADHEDSIQFNRKKKEALAVSGSDSESRKASNSSFEEIAGPEAPVILL